MKFSNGWDIEMSLETQFDLALLMFAIILFAISGLI